MLEPGGWAGAILAGGVAAPVLLMLGRPSGGRPYEKCCLLQNP